MMMADHHHHDERSPLLRNNNNDGIEPNQNDQEIQRIRSSSSRRDSPQYEGLPEVKKKLRWIVPAVAIGVKFFFFFFFFFFCLFLSKKTLSLLFPLFR